MPAEALVDVRSVNFSYDAHDPRPVLRGIDLRVPRGRMVAIMGASGSGKTTLLRLIGGQLRAGEGEVLVAGRSMGRIDSAELYRLRRRMGMLFQFGALFTDLSVFENVAFPVREHTRLPEAVVRDLVLLKLEAVGMRGARSLMPAELSGGMARRVALARAVALDPLLVLYDEPFAGLDPIAMAVIGQLMRRLNDALGATSIVVSHDVVECLAIVDYVYLIADGLIVGEGTPEEMRRSVLPYVRQFVQGELEGPVPFHYPARSYAEDVHLDSAAGHA
ncbi:MAG TPA: ABC transporter ATP-binding protein [Usitatibacter sp.]|nr:ABC transporter ATP-binding protein [Usitatibacter sp.]